MAFFEPVLSFFGSILGMVLLILGGFLALIKGADMLVVGASSLAKRLRVPDLAIGLTVVAMGTSAPELVVNIVSGTDGLSGVVFGNIIGSNLFNTFIILGLASIIYPIDVEKDVLKRDIPFSLLSLVVLYILVNDQLIFGRDTNTLGFYDSLILLFLFCGFLWLTFRKFKQGPEEDVEGDEIELKKTWVSTVLILLGITGLVLGGNLVVNNSVAIARQFDISDDVIGLTILAVGTSLPELATSCVAAFQRKADLAVGNIVGSNIFNILLVLGTSGIVSYKAGVPLDFMVRLNQDLYFFLLGMILLILFMFTFKSRKVDRWEGFIFILAFLGYSYFIILDRL
ncbi:MAG: calcium/sodium antiporter [Cytophagales bacterium]|nr:calcium/sodium antiporter [Cytophagales bacterium]